MFMDDICRGGANGEVIKQISFYNPLDILTGRGIIEDNRAASTCNIEERHARGRLAALHYVVGLQVECTDNNLVIGGV